MKDFIIIGSLGSVTQIGFFPLLKEGLVSLGTEKPRGFDNTDKVMLFSRWFTTLSSESKKTLVPTATYSPEKYPKYDNYEAIEVGRLSDIPTDYYGVMGVPVSIFDKCYSEQFDIVGCADANVVPEEWKGMSREFVNLYFSQGNNGHYNEGNPLCHYILNGKAVVPYKRILIKRKEI